MTHYRKTKPSFLEAGLPCASLSAECQRANNARQRPPQNRLHIWWARRPPTISRAAILSALLPHDLFLSPFSLPQEIAEPDENDLADLPKKLQQHIEFYLDLLRQTPPTKLTYAHSSFVQALGIMGDSAAAQQFPVNILTI